MEFVFNTIEEAIEDIRQGKMIVVVDDEEREIILLHAISGFKHREIAKSLGFSLGTVLSKYNRGLKKLKKHLSEQGVQG